MVKVYIKFNSQKRIEAEKITIKRWKSVVQINEQCYIWRNNGKIEKQNRCKASKNNEIRLFKICIKTKLYAAQNSSQ